MDYESRSRQFWVRLVLAVGMLWGVIPLIMVPFATRGVNDSALDVWAAVVCGLTILPASFLGFWHRRLACVWLSLNGALLLCVVRDVSRRGNQPDVGTIISLAVPVLLAVCLDYMELSRWPDAIDRRDGSVA